MIVKVGVDNVCLDINFFSCIPAKASTMLISMVTTYGADNMNQRNTANQLSSSKRHADPPKSDGGAFINKGVVQDSSSSLPRNSSYGNIIVCAPNDIDHSNNTLPARRSRRRPHPSATIPGTDPQLFARHRRRGRFEDPAYAAVSQRKNDMNNQTGEKYSPSIKGNTSSSSFSDRIPTAVLVLFWYSFGILSIATSKILLSTYNLPPLLLTFQQLVIGVLLLRTLVYVQTNGRKEEEYTSARIGLQPVPLQVNKQEDCENGGMYKQKSSNEIDPRTATRSTTQQQQGGILSAVLALANPSAINHRIHNQLLLSAIYFTIGFLLTNYGFSSGSAAFVETVKAAEPITSAATAVVWGIEQLVPEEVASLGGIIVGVVLSTLGHRGSGTSLSKGDELEFELTTPPHSQSLLTSSCIVLLANLCFSFRGLHQKLFRSTPHGKASDVDDLNLQYRMQQIGCLLLSIPVVLGNSSLPLRVPQYLSVEGGVSIRLVLRYFMLCFVNGVAFASYNLSSTTILTRISVVHHAALNCIRRVFAIVITSIVFGLQISFLQIGGISISVGAFFSYIHFKSKKSMRQSRRREMKKKWGSLMLDARRGNWGKTSSSLPMGSAED